MGYDPEQGLNENFYDTVVEEYDPTGVYSDEFSQPIDGAALEDPVESAGADEYTNQFGA
jgi:hypothetical protein